VADSTFRVIRFQLFSNLCANAYQVCASGRHIAFAKRQSISLLHGLGDGHGAQRDARADGHALRLAHRHGLRLGHGLRHAQPAAHEHARLRYRRPNLEFRRELVEAYDDPCDAVVFCQTIEHIHEPEKLLDRIASIAPVAYITTPNRLTLAPDGAEKSDNPWHIREYDAGEYQELLEKSFDRVRILGLFHSGKLRLHEHALSIGWDRVHKGLGITERFYDRFTPSISTSDFALRPGNLDEALDFVAVCSSDRARGN
jgi:hypothetical protein